MQPLDRLLSELETIAHSRPPAFPQQTADPSSLTTTKRCEDAERLLQQRFDLAAEPQIQFQGPIDWTFDPTADPRKRWARELNRHQWVVTLAQAYRSSGDERFAAKLVAMLVDWINKNPPPGRMNEADPVWTLMGVGMRASVWPAAFFTLLDSPAFDRVARVLLLESIHDHGEFLCRFKTHANHLLRESNGLLALAGYFPFFNAASRWRTRALERLDKEAARQVYPDGCHQEMSSGYQWMVAEELEAADTLLDSFDWSLPTVNLKSILRRMYGQLAFIARPDGSWPQLGDGFFDTPKALRKRMAEAGAHFDRPDFIFVGEQGCGGSPPPHTSIGFPDGGLVVMRSDWSREADYLLFKAGPFGGAHGHEDKLSIEVCAEGHSFLIDPGTYTYHAEDPYRAYFVSSNAHNTVVVDGMSQIRRWMTAHREPTGHTGERVTFANGEGYTYAAAEYDLGYAPYEFRPPEEPSITHGVRHTREILWVNEQYWLLIDRMDAREAHTYSRIFQTAAGTRVHSLKAGVALESPESDASLLLVNPMEDVLSIDTVEGQDPGLDLEGGWACNGQRGHKEPAPKITLSDTVSGPTTLLTLLVSGHTFSATRAPEMHRQPLSSGAGLAVKIDFGSHWDTLVLSTNRAAKRIQDIETTARIAAYRRQPGDIRDSTLFEITDTSDAGARNGPV